MFVETQNLAPGELYQLLVGGIIPRPIAWVSTQNAQGLTNIAPYSFFSVASCNPPILTLTNVPSQSRLAKDTLTNLLATQQCVVNIVSQSQLAQMNASCANYSPLESEIDALNIETQASQKVSPPTIKSSPVSYECTLRETITLSDQPIGGILVLLDVVAIKVKDEVLTEGVIDANRLDTLGKLGGNDYCQVKADIHLPRP